MVSFERTAARGQSSSHWRAAGRDCDRTAPLPSSRR
jgi:hypothetical protein